MSPESLDGLEEFSHVWLTFKFHLNTNTLKESKAFSGMYLHISIYEYLNTNNSIFAYVLCRYQKLSECMDIFIYAHVYLYTYLFVLTYLNEYMVLNSGTVHDSQRYTFTAKITPPMLKEKKVHM
jgi:hypothetical protein